jgi:hypothetical protein
MMEKSKGLIEPHSKQSPGRRKPMSKALFFFSDLTTFELAKNSPDVRGWELRDAENHLIGRVDDLLVSKEEKVAVYLDLEVDATVIEKGKVSGPLYHHTETAKEQNKSGDDHLFIPVEWVIPDDKNKTLITHQISYEAFIKARRFSRSARKLPAYPIDQFRK